MSIGQGFGGGFGGGIGQGAGIQYFGIGGGNEINPTVERGVYNVRTPTSLPVRFSQSKVLRLVVVPVNDWCTINLRGGGDIALHFNLRFAERSTVRNAKINGNWGGEERDGGFPFERDQIYTLEFIPQSHNDSVAVFLNGQHFTDFRLRTRLYEIDTVEIEDGFKVHSVQAFS
ncbi:unnamed protein product [Bursaphelenchus xylophilus]|uniref:Galectin n=1 Tax=Bursaphelenchus xylophilus TaxID=6326 RepID=A0A1I7RN55_BURXY|nr:unnamed protein product [Bursaphelenchus xylophilus]CAG9087717.1 unnamed protein product [Bursaphelenchus xylophilus]